MSKHKYANWVKGVFLQLVKEEQSSNQSFHKSSLFRFFTRDDSKYKVKTLCAIAQAKSDVHLTSPVLELEALEILRVLLHEMEHDCTRHKSIGKKDHTRAVNQFRKAAHTLASTLDFTHSYHAHDLIKDAPAMWVGSPTSSMGIHQVELTESIKTFWGKTALQVLLEYADKVESLGTGNQYYLVNNREPTQAQFKIRLCVYLVIAMVDLKNIGSIKNLGALITHLMIILSPEYENLERNDVNKLLKTAISICEVHGQPITME